MHGLNIDPRNPQGNPTAAELHDLGIDVVRYTFKDGTTDKQPTSESVSFYRREVARLSGAGQTSLILLNHETLAERAPSATDSEEMWVVFRQTFAERAANIAKVLARWRPAFQIWQAPDQLAAGPTAVTTLSADRFGQLLQVASEAIKQVDADLPVVAGGLVSGQPAWLAEVKQGLGGQLPVDVIAIHPYTQRPTPDWPRADWGSGYVSDLIQAYQTVTDLPLWLTEIGVDSLGAEEQGAYLSRFYNTISRKFGDVVPEVFWFSYSDAMAYPFGLVDSLGQPKPAYEAYKKVASTGLSVARAISTAATISLDRLHLFAGYLEQYLVFGERDYALHQQMATELRGNRQRLSRADIWYIMNRMLTGSPHTIEQPEIEALDALQAEKDLYGMLRSIVLAAHQKTGALTGRIGPHVRISAETEANARTNIKAVMQVAQHILSGNRLLVMDTVKANADEAKLREPDIFETNIYGQHRNGLIDNHAWNLQKLVRTIRDQGFQDRVMLIMRLDGPDGGANVNIFNGNSVQKYELAIFKFIRYLETMLPDAIFKLVLGNEPDLPHERLWSDPNVNSRTFTFEQYAPPLGAFLKRLAQRRPDVTFICPALSAYLKNEQLTYHATLFGKDRPDNLVPALHGYAGDVAVQMPGRQNLIEQQAEILRGDGKFRHISGTEIGSNNRFADGESLSEKNRFDDVVLWLLLSASHDTPVGQDNNWSFSINSEGNDPLAQTFAHLINRGEQRVLRNIKERSGEIQIVRYHIGLRPAYAVEYVNHTTPSQMLPGQTKIVIMTLRNTSYRTWPAGGPNPVRLGYHWYTRTGQAIPADLWADNRTQLPYDVLPGASVTLAANLGAPRQVGSFEVRWDMVEESITWFAWQGTPTLNLPLTIGDGDQRPPTLSILASHNNVQTGADNLQQAIDNNVATRWSSRALQQPGMWLEIDLGEVRSVRGLVLDSARSPEDYPRGYIVKLSTDRQQWTEMARNAQNGGVLDVNFSSRQARYVRIEQTGSSDRWWWSVHEITLR